MGTISNSSILGADQPGSSNSSSTLSFTPAPIGSQDAERQDGGGRTRAAFAYVWQRPRWLLRFLAGFIVIVALAWKGLNMGEAPVPRQSQAPDIESGMLLAQNAPPPDASPSDTPAAVSEAVPPDATSASTTPASSASTARASSNAKTAVSKSKKQNKYSNAKRKPNRSVRTARHIKLIASPVGDHAGVTYIKLP